MQAVCHMQAVFDMQGGDRPCERTGREDASKMQARCKKEPRITSRGLGWRMHCGVEGTESSTNKQDSLSRSRHRTKLSRTHALTHQDARSRHTPSFTQCGCFLDLGAHQIHPWILVRTKHTKLPPSFTHQDPRTTHQDPTHAPPPRLEFTRVSPYLHRTVWRCGRDGSGEGGGGGQTRGTCARSRCAPGLLAPCPAAAIPALVRAAPPPPPRSPAS
jgi:hypothetical protein